MLGRAGACASTQRDGVARLGDHLRQGEGVPLGVDDLGQADRLTRPVFRLARDPSSAALDLSDRGAEVFYLKAQVNSLHMGEENRGSSPITSL